MHYFFCFLITDSLKALLHLHTVIKVSSLCDDLIVQGKRSEINVSLAAVIVYDSLSDIFLCIFFGFGVLFDNTVVINAVYLFRTFEFYFRTADNKHALYVIYDSYCIFRDFKSAVLVVYHSQFLTSCKFKVFRDFSRAEYKDRVIIIVLDNF